MNRYLISITLTLCLLGSAFAQNGTPGLPNERPYNIAVSLNAGLSGTPLEAALRQLARSVGLTPILTDIPGVVIKDSINSLPFRQAWELLINLQPGALDYVVLPGGVIRVGSPAAIKALRPAPPSQPVATPPTPPTPAAPPTPPPPTTSLVEYPLKGSATDVEAALRTFVSEVSRYRIVRGVLIVEATEAQHAKVKEILALVDKEPPPLPSPSPSPATPSESAPPPQFLKEYPLRGERADVEEGLRTFVPDLQNRFRILAGSIIVKATEREIELLEAVLELINRAKPTPPAPPPPPAPVVVPPKPTLTKTYRTDSDPTNLLAALKRYVGDVEATYFPEGRALVIRATEEEHLAIAKALEELKGLIPPKVEPPAPPPPPAPTPPAPPEPILQQRFSLEHTKASEALAIAQNLLGIKMQADGRTNSILASGTKAELQRLGDLLSSLDTALPQVALRIRVETLEKSTADKLGIEWSANIGGVNLTLSSGSIKAGIGQDPFEVISATLNALQQKGGATSELMIDQLVQHNEQADFNKGGQVLLIVPGANGQSTLQSFNYGISVSVKPVVQQGRILLEFSTEVGEEPVEGVNNSIKIPKASLKTRITLESGQTVVLGGLVNNRSAGVTKGLPLLSDIPILGALFREEDKSSSQSTVLYIISAVVLKPGETVKGPFLKPAVGPVDGK